MPVAWLKSGEKLARMVSAPISEETLTKLSVTPVLVGPVRTKADPVVRAVPEIDKISPVVAELAVITATPVVGAVWEEAMLNEAPVWEASLLVRVKIFPELVIVPAVLVAALVIETVSPE